MSLPNKFVRSIRKRGFRGAIEEARREIEMSISCNLIVPARKRYLKKNAMFKDIHHGERCFIVGTGPSLTNYDISNLRTERVFACNWFTLHSEWEELRHLYYVITDPFFWKGHRLHEDLRQALLRRGSTGCFFAINDISPRCVEKDAILLERTDCHLIGINKREGIWEGFFQWDLTELLYRTSTVLFMALPIAIYMGFKKIYFLGFDNDYGTGPNGREEDYFYDLADTGKRNVSSHMSIPDSLRDTNMMNIVKGARVIERRLRHTDVEVYLDTRFSTIDAFPSFDFDELFHEAL